MKIRTHETMRTQRTYFHFRWIFHRQFHSFFSIIILKSDGTSYSNSLSRTKFGYVMNKEDPQKMHH
jgi:hypothetical protein